MYQVMTFPYVSSYFGHGLQHERCNDILYKLHYISMATNKNSCAKDICHHHSSNLYFLNKDMCKSHMCKPLPYLQCLPL